jgi:hypothetical protein
MRSEKLVQLEDGVRGEANDGSSSHLIGVIRVLFSPL